MGYNRFYIIVTALSVLIGATSFVFVWTLGKDYLIIGKFLVALLWFIELLILIRFVNRTNSSLSIFLEALRASDFMNNSEKADNSIDKLNLSYNKIIEIVKQARLDQQSQYLYFQNTLEHISTGIISFKNDGTVDLFNKSAQEILELKYLHTIDDLYKLSPDFAEILKKIENGKEALLNLKSGKNEKRIVIKASQFVLMSDKITLLSLQDIKSELEIEEQSAWQKLIRVLTHEIMNSIGPMKSITSSTLKLFLNKEATKKAKDINDEIIEDTVLGLQTLQERNNGLMSFVKSYKKLIKIPVPKIQDFDAKGFLLGFEQFFREDFSKHNIEATFHIDDDNKRISADENLLSQVMINLLKNAIEALEGVNNKQINVSTYIRDSKQYIEITDNGKGMSEEVKSQIFIPFYTTKSDGEGIGLSLSRQIILAHNGDLMVESELNEGAKFTIKI